MLGWLLLRFDMLLMICLILEWSRHNILFAYSFLLINQGVTLCGGYPSIQLFCEGQPAIRGNSLIGHSSIYLVSCTSVPAKKTCLITDVLLNILKRKCYMLKLSFLNLQQNFPHLTCLAGIRYILGWTILWFR